MIGLGRVRVRDAAFPALGYWRRYVWGPMAQLTFWGLQVIMQPPIIIYVYVYVYVYMMCGFGLGLGLGRVRVRAREG